jgi:hypothetical protein
MDGAEVKHDWQADLVAIDPGPEESAYVLMRGGELFGFGKEGNESLVKRLAHTSCHGGRRILVIEQVASMGMAVGAEVFETVFWSGRFAQAWQGDWDRVKRHEVKSHLCHHPRAKDGNIRQSIIDRFGGKEKAIGKKKSPGPLYGISGDVWQALAVAITWTETKSA